MSQLLDPWPEPLCRWYPGGVPSKHTETKKVVCIILTQRLEYNFHFEKKAH
jgi:hypothetical protein